MNEKRMAENSLKTKLLMSAFFLSAFLLFSGANAYVVVDPYNANNTLIRNPIFDELFVDQMYSEKVIPVTDNGTVDFYLAGADKCFDARGDICAAIFCGNAICGSKRFDNETDLNSIDYGLISGNNLTHEIIGVQNAMRYAAISSDEYLSLVEKNLAESGGSALDNAYFQERYSYSVDRMIDEEIMNDPAMMQVDELLKRGLTNDAIAAADKYFSGKYNISSAYDAYDIFSAVQKKTIGPMQYSEIMSRILTSRGVTDAIGRVMNQSSILNQSVNADVMNQALDVIGKNPELFSELQKAMLSLDDKRFEDMMSRMLEETFKNKELMKKLLDILPDIMNDKKMRESFLSSSAEAIRALQKSGDLGKMMDTLDDPALRERMMKFAEDAAPSVFDAVKEKAKGLLEEKYVLAIIGLVAFFIVSTKVRL